MVDSEKRSLVWGMRREPLRILSNSPARLRFFSFHIEHIIPRQHSGSDDSENLCLACRECNLSKGTNLTGLLDGKIVPLFHPRRQIWKHHFRWEAGLLIGKTRCGKVTIEVLNINHAARVIVRQNLCDEGRFPPPEA